jgi:hypothetical protein
LVSMNFIPFRVFSMRVFVNATASPLLNWNTTARFVINIAWQHRPLWTRAGCQYFSTKWTDPPRNVCIVWRQVKCANFIDGIDLLSFTQSGAVE